MTITEQTAFAALVSSPLGVVGSLAPEALNARLGALTRAAPGSPYLDSRQKRAIDLVASLLLLLILLPLLLVLAALVKATSPGPVLFRQLRHGAGMRPFSILKFRTMYDREPGPNVVQATRNDPRVTPLGRILRRTSLDELPQLINVMRGEMSLVGPRPHAVSHDEIFALAVEGYFQRFAAKPGLTGLAQVNGARGGTPDIRDVQRRVTFDVAYIKSASVWLDIRILFRTARELLGSGNAY